MIPKKRQKWYLAAAIVLLGGFGMLIGMGIEHQRQIKQAEMPPEWGLSGRIQAPTVRQTKSGNYLALQVALSRQDFETAAHYGVLMAKRNELDEDTINTVLRVFIAAGRMKEAQALLTQTLALDDMLALQVDIMRLIKLHDYAGALEVLSRMPELLFNVEQLVFSPAKAWILAGKYEASKRQNADATQPPQKLSAEDIDAIFEPMKPLEKIDAIAGFTTFQKALLYDWLGLNEEAHKAYQSVQEHSLSLPFRSAQIIRNFYVRQGDWEAVKALSQQYEEQNPDSSLHLPDMPVDDERTMNVAPMIANPEQAVAELYFTVASLLFEEDPTLRPILFLQLALWLRPDFPPAQMLLAAIFEQFEQYEAAVAVYQSMDTKSVFYKQGRVRVALNYHAAGRKEEAIELLRQIIKDEPRHEEAVMLLGDMLRHEKRYDDSIQVFRRALKDASSEDWGWQFFYKYAMTLERAGRWKEAEPMLKKALELEPDQPDVLNYLGYSWLEKDVNLEKAKEYIEKAHAIEPGQAHIIDSLGWAYYKLKNYPRALSYLEQAIELAPQDPTLNDHLGDVYWRLGRRTEARFQWQRALTFESEHADAIERKLEKGLQPPAP